MNTKTFKKSFTKNASLKNATHSRAKKYVLPLVVVIAVLLAFSNPAVADYSGDHPMTIYDHDTINGGLVYETVTDGSKYEYLYPQPGPPLFPFVFVYQNLTITLPEGATVKTARLYNYYTWSCWQDNDTIGVPAQATLNLTDTASGETWTRTCSHSYTPATRDDCPNPIVYSDPVYGDVVHYWDTKGQNYPSKMWDVPSGTFAWNVTGLVTHSGTYNASIRDSRAQFRVGDERFCTFGFGLLVVYEKPSSPKIGYWIAEGCDILNNCSGGNWETWENATTNATFGGVSGATDANLTTVLDCSDGGSTTPPGNMIYFNGEEIGSSTAEGIEHIGVNYFDVTENLSSDQNVVGFQDRGDYEGVHNAFLVVEYEEAGICGDVNKDGFVDVLDATGVWNRAMNPNYPLDDEGAADVNCDTFIDVLDATGVWNRAMNPNYPLNCCGV